MTASVDDLLFRVYLDPQDIAKTGYPIPWEKEITYHPTQVYGEHVYVRTRPSVLPRIPDRVRALAGHRCVRCLHPYQDVEYLGGQWSPCDEQCVHGGPIRVWSEFGRNAPPSPTIVGPHDVAAEIEGGFAVDAEWRILTVHHLNGAKADCRWWNLVALCQRCHLSVQARVVMERPFLLEHSDWFKPYVAGFYAWRYLGQELTRAQVDERLDELLALEHRQTTIEDA